MADYIEREAAREMFVDVLCESWHNSTIVDAEDALNFIDDIPAADVAPVVRCGDCKHRDPSDKRCDCGHDIQWQLPRQDDWFCADGERREVRDGRNH